MLRSVQQVLVPLLAVLLAMAAVLIAIEAVHRTLLRLSRYDTFPHDLARRAHRPAQWFAVVTTANVTLNGLLPPGGRWRSAILHLVELALIGVTAWLVGTVLVVVEDRALRRYRTDVSDNRIARKIHTQVRIIRRVTIAVIAVLTVAGMLTTFPSARATGRSLLLSAGVVAALVAFASQSVLMNMLSGVQLALSGAIRLDDVVIVEKEWGHVEELTLTHVVVRIWDDRRLVLPTSYFASHPFQNWTRTASHLLGTVELDVDWTVPLQPMREELQRIVSDSPLWDERLSLLQVTGATGAVVRVRCLVSAGDADTLWDLRCLVRERLVEWLRDQQPQALPRLRTEVDRAAVPISGVRYGRLPGTDTWGVPTG
ncbi:mechanosensitive ion channel family protein [Planosporangium sp. 12N6]|uniref:mechanosensitive ion channel family protein n=1 Tax=Planosporangium spinosum TaxID=3402278 RepID=UPI003CF88668